MEGYPCLQLFNVVSCLGIKPGSPVATLAGQRTEPAYQVLARQE